MPNFENIDQYEARNPKSGNKEIIPIAPHSLQASDYRPRKRAASEVKSKEKVPSYPEVNIEPISIQQMEKEYRQAGRQINRRTRQSRGSQSLWKRFTRWLQSLLKSGKGRQPRSQQGKRRSQRPRKPADKGDGKRGPQKKGEGQETQDRNRNRRRRRRPRGKGPPDGGKRQQGGGQAPRGRGPQGKASDKGPDTGESPKKRSRNRRNRNRRGPRGGQKGNPDSGNSQ